MNGFTSGTQARDGRRVNHDPEPYVGIRGRQSRRYGLGTEALSPRSKYSVRDNPILAELRRNERDIFDLLFDLDSRWAAQFSHAEIEHAERVLFKLASLK